MPISHLLAESFYHPECSSGDVTILDNGLVIQPTTHAPHSLSSGNRQNEDKFVLIDTDAGPDDAWAIFMALASQRNSGTPKFTIVGITTVYGNTRVENVANNVTRTLDTINDTTIPIFKGMEEPFIEELRFTDDPPFYGEDGFGDANLPTIPTRIEAEHSVDAIIRFAETYQGRLTILALGPLTNLAMALKKQPQIKNFVKELYILGGNVEGLGNVTPSSEFNFYMDPESAYVVLKGFSPCPVTIIPWETCSRYATSTIAFRVNTLGGIRTAEMTLLNAIEKKTIDEFYKETWLAADAVLAACLINPIAVTRQENYYCSVELQGKLTRGMMVVDRGFIEQKPSNATIILEVNRPIIESMLIWAAGGPLPKSLNTRV